VVLAFDTLNEVIEKEIYFGAEWWTVWPNLKIVKRWPHQCWKYLMKSTSKKHNRKLNHPLGRFTSLSLEKEV
jgi:hypothetical protein